MWPGVYANKAALAIAQAGERQAHALRVAAVRASVGGDCVASHHSAAVLYGLELLSPAPDLVTLTRAPEHRSGGRRSKGVFSRTAPLPAGDVTKVFGVPVTTVARTVVDLARAESFTAGVVVADSALRAGLATTTALLAVCDACPGWPGIRRARRVAAFADERAESVLESAARVVFAEHGLEPPELQVAIRGPSFNYAVDFYWARYRTAAEADGAMKYSDPKRAVRQLRRDQELRDAGEKVVHLSWRDFFAGQPVLISRIRRAWASPTAV